MVENNAFNVLVACKELEDVIDEVEIVVAENGSIGDHWDVWNMQLDRYELKAKRIVDDLIHTENL